MNLLCCIKRINVTARVLAHYRQKRTWVQRCFVIVHWLRTTQQNCIFDKLSRGLWWCVVWWNQGGGVYLCRPLGVSLPGTQMSSQSRCDSLRSCIVHCSIKVTGLRTRLEICVVWVSRLWSSGMLHSVELDCLTCHGGNWIFRVIIDECYSNQGVQCCG